MSTYYGTPSTSLGTPRPSLGTSDGKGRGPNLRPLEAYSWLGVGTMEAQRTFPVCL